MISEENKIKLIYGETVFLSDKNRDGYGHGKIIDNVCEILNQSYVALHYGDASAKFKFKYFFNTRSPFIRPGTSAEKFFYSLPENIQTEIMEYHSWTKSDDFFKFIKKFQKLGIFL